MPLKTKIEAEEGRQDLRITREFELPVELLFKAYVEAELVAQWMGTEVIKLDSQKHGSYEFATRNPQGEIVLRMRGSIHECILNEKIIRTFEMEGMPFPPQLEFLEFESLGEETSKLTMHVIYKSGDVRDQILKLPFAKGINMAHNRIQELFTK